MINFCLYADTLDGPTKPLIEIVTSQFRPATLCTTFEEVEQTLTLSPNVVLMIPPQSGENAVHLAEKKWVNEIEILTRKNIQVVFFATEIDLLNQSLTHLSKIPNLLIVIPAQHTFGMKHYPWVIWQHWLQDAALVYQKPGLRNYIDTFIPSYTRPMLFDVLLGGERPYRTMMYNWIKQDPVLSSKTVMTYYGNVSDRSLILEPGMSAPDDLTNFHTGVNCEFLDVNTRISVIPPVSVYQQCAYSLVTETTAEHNYVFFTEKIARPIMCQRLFIVLSSYKYLYYLREAGFQTFDGIINESYDLEVDDAKRWRLAFEQMQHLASMDQQQVLKQIAPIVKHNQTVLLETDWNKKMYDRVNQIVCARNNYLM